jgi:hypothetical protein
MAMRKHELAGQHDELVLDMDRLHLLVVSPDDALPERRMRALLVRELRDFAAELEYHFGYEEEGGYLTAVTDQRPGLSRRVDDLQGQHTAILQRIEEVCSEAEALPVRGIKVAISEVLDLLGEHERSEKTLLHEGVVTDLGTGD